jgi:Nickel responsive protein SCO4226-like
MPRYLIRRLLGDITEAELQAAAEVSRQVRFEQFPDIECEHSHVVRTPDGLTSYCVYAAATAQRVRDHATAAGLPADEVQEIAHDLFP